MLRRVDGGPWSIPVVAATAVGLGTTVAVIVIPSLRFAYESLELHVALESAQGVIALLLCYLSFGRFRTTMRLRHLLLMLAFAAFAATNLFVSALPVALERETIGFTSWLATGLRLVAAVALALAAVRPDRTVSRDGLVVRIALVSVAVLAAVVVGAALAESTLADLVDPSLSPEASHRPLLAGHAVAVAVQVASTVIMAVAAAAFLGLARRTGDDLYRWLAAGATLGAFARLNYVLFPSLYTRWFYTGDLLRFGSYVLFLVGAAREMGVYWRGHAQVAVMEERRRVARELHDGLTQELSFIRSQLASGTERPLSPDAMRFVAEAADRALDESRRAVAVLADDALEDRPPDEPLPELLLRTAELVAGREGVAVALGVADPVPVDDGVRRDLERIVREAVVNAVRHGGASAVGIDVRAVDGSVVVEVTDDGRGFEPAVAPGTGFGLRSMAQRAESRRGTLLVESAPGQGTRVRATVPVSIRKS